MSNWVYGNNPEHTSVHFLAHKFIPIGGDCSGRASTPYGSFVDTDFKEWHDQALSYPKSLRRKMQDKKQWK